MKRPCFRNTLCLAKLNKEKCPSMSVWQEPCRQRKKHLASEGHSSPPYCPRHFSFISPLFCRFQQCWDISANSSYCPHLFCNSLLSNRLFFLCSFNKSEFIDVYRIQGADNNIYAHFLSFSLLALGIWQIRIYSMKRYSLFITTCPLYCENKDPLEYQQDT